MKRRKFTKNVTGVVATGLFAPGNVLFAGINREKFPSLADHKIEKAELVTVDHHWPRFVGKNGARDVHGQYNQAMVLRLITDQGALGWGVSDRKAEDSLPRIMDKNVADLISPEEGIAPGLNAFHFDLPLFDLMGVILDKPVYEILGKEGHRETPVYSGMIYLDELPSEGVKGGLDTIMNNCAWDYDYGYRQFKIKIGRGKKWYPPKKGMEMDIRVVKMIYQEYRDKGVQLLVDANNSYTLEDTITFLRGIGDIPLFWVEEPFPEAHEQGRKLREWMDKNGFSQTRYADGEWVWPDAKEDVALEMIDQKIVNTYLNDIHAYGITNWIKVMSRLKKNNTNGSPHTWGDRLKTHYTAHLAAGLGNVATVEGVTGFSDDIDYGDYPIKNGKIKASNKAGFGMKLLK